MFKNDMQRFRPDIYPMAEEKAMIVSGNARFTVLTQRLIRCEYSNSGVFEDRASQHIWNRSCSAPFDSKITDNVLIIETTYLKLKYKIGKAFEDNLAILIKESNHEWHYGDVDKDNLFGTARTLDNCDGNFHTHENKKLELSKGLLSKSGWSVIDDSNTLVFDDDCFLHLREGTSETDIYFLGYSQNYKECIKDYYYIAGKVPLVPKWALGLWWSRWESYNQEDVLKNVDEFRQHGIPLSNHVIDMDWHVIKNDYTNGWTGYTWNKDFFPNPKELFDKLHAEDIHACLNLHPADGVYPHEERYPEMARHMGVDPESKTPIKFDISDPKYITGYFDILHHPLEEEGVDFWWIDWQQETTSKLKGLDPLWFLNHLHSLDLKRGGKKRSMTFSRWGDNGCHRYPIGFSGDTYGTWNTLGFLPYFNANAANLGYGWWSHDVGGFQKGPHKDHELYTRWVQFSIFSPIFRFHCSGDPTIDNKPWSKPAEYCDATIQALKLRRALIPYIYTQAWKNHTGGTVLCRPMYHDYPEAEQSYLVPDQFMFGDNMLIAPFTKQADPSVGLSRTVVWLPEGGWYNMINGEYYSEPGFYPLYGDINNMNIFVKSGSVIPMSIQNQDVLIAFPGDGETNLYDDDGESMSYESGDYNLYNMKLSAKEGKGKLQVTQLHGKEDKKFSFAVVEKGWNLFDFIENPSVKIIDNIINFEFTLRYFKFELTKDGFKKLASNFDITGHAFRPMYTNFHLIQESLLNLRPYLMEFNDAQLKCILETGTGCGFAFNRLYNGDDVLISWNHNNDQDFEVVISKRYEYWYESQVMSGKSEECFVFPSAGTFLKWRANVTYKGLLSYSIMS